MRNKMEMQIGADRKGSAAGASTSGGSVIGGAEADGLYDIELKEEAITSPLQEGENFLGAQYFDGLENVSAAYLVGYTWYRDTEYFYVYSRNVLAVLRSDGGEAYTLGLEGTIVDVCMTKEGDIALVEDRGVEGEELKILNRESGALSGKYMLFVCYGMAEGAAKGVLITDLNGVYDLDVESGKKSGI